MLLAAGWKLVPRTCAVGMGMGIRNGRAIRIRNRRRVTGWVVGGSLNGLGHWASAVLVWPVAACLLIVSGRLGVVWLQDFNSECCLTVRA